MSLQNRTRRLHPYSIAFEVLSSIRSYLFPALFALFSAARGGTVGLFISIAIMLLSLGLAIFKYWTLRYSIVNGELVVEEGLLFRKHRTVPLRRIQNVDLSQNILHRLLRVAEVRIETASGVEPEATLRVLSLRDVEELRASIFAGVDKSDREVGTDEELADHAAAKQKEIADETPLLKLDIMTLVKAGLANDRGMLMLAVIAGTAYQFEPWERVRWKLNWKDLQVPARLDWGYFEWTLVAIGVSLLGFVLLRLLSALWYVTRFYGYRLTRAGDDLRIRCGLLTQVSASVPRQRIQKISIHRTWWGRSLKIASIRVETAGGGAEQSENTVSTVSRKWFIPAIDEKDISRVLEEIRPGLAWDEKSLPWKPLASNAVARLRKLSLIVTIIAFIPAIYFQSILACTAVLSFGVFSYFYARKKAASCRWARNELGVVYRSGLLTRKCSLAFAEAIEAVTWSQSPFDRKWGMATLSIDTPAAGPAEHLLAVEMLDAQFALEERDAIAKLASRSRRAS